MDSMNRALNGEEEICVICQHGLTEKPTITLTCNHIFHALCIQNWKTGKPDCPLCRCPLTTAIAINHETHNDEGIDGDNNDDVTVNPDLDNPRFTSTPLTVPEERPRFVIFENLDSFRINRGNYIPRIISRYSPFTPTITAGNGDNDNDNDGDDGHNNVVLYDNDNPDLDENNQIFHFDPAFTALADVADISVIQRELYDYFSPNTGAQTLHGIREETNREGFHGMPLRSYGNFRADVGYQRPFISEFGARVSSAPGPSRQELGFPESAQGGSQTLNPPDELLSFEARASSEGVGPRRAGLLTRLFAKLTEKPETD